MPTQHKNSFFYAFQDMSRHLRRRFDEMAQQYDITSPQWRALRQLAVEDHISQSALASQIDADPMTVSGLMERLEAKGLVARQPDPGDSRAKIVILTDKANALVTEVRALADDVYAEAFEGIGDRDRQITLDVMNQVAKNLSATRPEIKKEQP